MNRRGIVAVAVESEIKQDPGFVIFFNNQGVFLNQLTVGALPDMLTFNAGGNWLLVANEGEPSDDHTVDPEGSISIIRTHGGENRIKRLRGSSVRTADFKRFNLTNIDPNTYVWP